MRCWDITSTYTTLYVSQVVYRVIFIKQHIHRGISSIQDHTELLAGNICGDVSI